MSLEAIQTVTQVEKETQEKLAAARAEAGKLTADAQRDGEALLRQIRSGAAEEGRALLRQAEERAAKQAEEIRREAQAQSNALRKRAEARLDQAAEYIAGRVVKH